MLNTVNHTQVLKAHPQQLNDLTKQQPIYPHWVGAR